MSFRIRRRMGVARSAPPRVHRSSVAERNAVDRYWTAHTVNSKPFEDPRASEEYLDWRFDQYPLFRELSGLWNTPVDAVVLDYGCGPGNDLVGFGLRSKARRIVGVDVSSTALELAAQRLALHPSLAESVDLVQISDTAVRIPLEDGSVDHVSSQGVLHHTTDPEAVLHELYRVLAPGGTGTIMVYNRDSIWLHLYTAYDKMIVEGSFPGLALNDAFARNTDGVGCPVSRAYRGDEFVTMCTQAGFEAHFVGGYLSRHELERIDASWSTAIADSRLDGEHRAFLRSLTFDRAGLPMYNGYHAGIGGTYRLAKSA